MQTTCSLMTVVVACGLLVACGTPADDSLDLGFSRSSVPSVSAATPSTSTSVHPAGSPTTVAERDPSTSASALSAQDQVSAAFLAAFAVRERCDYDPAACDYGAIAVPDSEMDRTVRRTMTNYLENNFRAVRGNGGLRIGVESVTLAADAAFVVTCIYDTEVIFDVGLSPQAFDDTVFNDFKQSDRVRWELRWDHDRWLIFLGVNLQALNGGDLCGF